MKVSLTIIFSCFIVTAMKSPTVQSTIAGEYYLQGVMETASGFKLNADSSFQFFFMYGAMDRYGRGQWSVQGDSVILTSTQRQTHDFALEKSEKGESDSVTIRMSDANEMLSRYLLCIIKGGGIEQQAEFDAEGTARFAVQPLDTITILFEFAPEKISRFNISQKEHHHFEFRSEPWIMEVFFDNFKLSYAGDHLAGANPLLNGSAFTYRKSGY
jgi:hypothetical protein